MVIVDPRVDPRLVPAGSKPQVINSIDRAYRDLPAIATPDGQVITRWSFTDAERAAVAAGEDIYVTLIAVRGSASGGVINPLFLTVGVVDWTKEPE